MADAHDLIMSILEQLTSITQDAGSFAAGVLSVDPEKSVIAFWSLTTETGQFRKVRRGSLLWLKNNSLGRQPKARRDMAAHLESPWRPVTFSQERRMKLRAGVVGLGKQALEDHIPGLHASDSAKLVAVCDENSDVVHEQQYQHRVQGYTDFREMFKAEHLDLVVVSVPHHVGRTVIELAAEHNVHVLKEKPFATSMEEAAALVEICERTGIQLMVTLQRRFNPIYTSFTQLADQIGTPFVVDAQYTESRQVSKLPSSVLNSVAYHGLISIDEVISANVKPMDLLVIMCQTSDTPAGAALRILDRKLAGENLEDHQQRLLDYVATHSALGVKQVDRVRSLRDAAEVIARESRWLPKSIDVELSENSSAVRLVFWIGCLALKRRECVYLPFMRQLAGRRRIRHSRGL